MKRITLAIDGSETSLRAADFAGELSEAFDLPVDIIHAIHPELLTAPTAGLAYERSEGVSVAPKELLLAQGEEYLVAAARRVKAAGGHVDKSKKRIGSPVKTIRDFADEAEADVVIVGSRGLGQVEGLLMGSVSHGLHATYDNTLVTVQ